MKTKKKILVIDDETKIRILLRKVLIKEGYEVLCVGDGITAIRNIKKEKFDLVLLDLKMPGIDGIETIRRIRKINKKIPVILMSAYLTGEDIKKANKLGISDYIEKPFKLDEVRLKIKRVLKKERD